MRVVLGIDAAWTTKNPSGFALALETSTGWKLVTASESYATFHHLTYGSESNCPTSLPKADVMLATAKQLARHSVTLVAVDMPLAHSPIIARRYSDNEVSRFYGAKHCSTHSPSAIRPGAISDNLRKDFAEAGYALCTQELQPQALIEVYPHPALVELADAAQRLPYKAGNLGKYWKDLSAEQRRYKLFKTWQTIENFLEPEISGVSMSLPKITLSSKVAQLKAYEDTLDAIICAWAGICALEGRAIPFGDAESAIWIPRKAPVL